MINKKERCFSPLNSCIKKVAGDITYLENLCKRRKMPSINPFDPNANRQSKVEHVLDRLKSFFAKYFGFANGMFSD